MTQSVVDLPDPLDQIASASLVTTTPAGVDDLLAQMAGDEVDRLLAEAEISRDGPIESTVNPTRQTAVTQLVADEKPAEAHEDLESATTTAERSGLEMPVEPITSETPAFSEEENGLLESYPTALAWYLRPLEWLNLPMQSLPAGVREAVGKIALLTLFNALAVLIYVFVFRKHH